MKKIFMIFCLISTTSFAGSEDPPRTEDNTELTGVKSSIPDVWDISVSEGLQIENVSVGTTYSAPYFSTVLCLFDDGEYWMGTATSTAAANGMISHCEESGGTVFSAYK